MITTPKLKQIMCQMVQDKTMYSNYDSVFEVHKLNEEKFLFNVHSRQMFFYIFMMLNKVTKETEFYKYCKTVNGCVRIYKYVWENKKKIIKGGNNGK